MTSPITVRYRINGGRGILYIRELILGEIAARVPSDLTISVTTLQEIIRLCSSSFDGPVESFDLDGDCLYVTCAIPTSMG